MHCGQGRQAQGGTGGCGLGTSRLPASLPELLAHSMALVPLAFPYKATEGCQNVTQSMSRWPQNPKNPLPSSLTCNRNQIRQNSPVVPESPGLPHLSPPLLPPQPVWAKQPPAISHSSTSYLGPLCLPPPGTLLPQRASCYLFPVPYLSHSAPRHHMKRLSLNSTFKIMNPSSNDIPSSFSLFFLCGTFSI